MRKETAVDPIAVEGWQELATVPITVAVSLAVVQFAKIFLDLGTRGWQRLSAAVAVVVIVGATIVDNGLGDELAIALAVVNGMIAGVAASRTFDVARDAFDG